MRSLLIVDDEVEYLKSLEVALRRTYSIQLALNLDSAIDIIKKGIDILLVDIRLDNEDNSNIDGLRILRWTKENFPSIPVFVMSAYREFNYAEEALNLGASHFFRKPIVISELTNIMSQKS